MVKNPELHDFMHREPDLTIYGLRNHPPSAATMGTAVALGLRVSWTDVSRHENLRKAFLEEGHQTFPIVIADGETWEGHDEKKLMDLAHRIVPQRSMVSAPCRKWIFTCPIEGCLAEYFGEFQAPAIRALKVHVRTKHRTTIDMVPPPRVVTF